MLINGKMPATTVEKFKAGKVSFFQHISFYEQLKCHAQSSLECHSFITSGPGSHSKLAGEIVSFVFRLFVISALFEEKRRILSVGFAVYANFSGGGVAEIVIFGMIAHGRVEFNELCRLPIAPSESKVKVTYTKVCLTARNANCSIFFDRGSSYFAK